MPKEHFALIPESTLLSCTYKALSKQARLLYIYLAVHRAGRDDWFTYSYQEIKKDAGYRYETIKKGLQCLETIGLLRYEHGGLLGKHNRYYLEPEYLHR